MPQPSRSVFVNVLAWVLLILIIASAVTALIYAKGTHELEYGETVKIKTSSAALIVMVFCSLVLLALVRLAAKGQIVLYDKGAGPKPTFTERNRSLLTAVSGAVFVIGLVILLIAYLR